MNNNFLTLLKELYSSFDDLTEFEDGKPQKEKDPMFGMWLSMRKISTSDKEVNDFVDLFLKKRQTKDGIDEMKLMIEQKLKGVEQNG